MTRYSEPLEVKVWLTRQGKATGSITSTIWMWGESRIYSREEPRWRRNRKGRPLSLLQIHRKNNWMLNKVHKTTSDASRGHQAPRKATHCLQRDVGQNIKDKKGDKRAREGDPSREGSLNRGSFQSPGNPRAGGSEGSFQILEGNLTGRKN